MDNKLLLLIYGLISSVYILSSDHDNLKTLVGLAPVATSHFAKDPHAFYEFVAENPDFAKLPYTQCVLKGFNAHTKLKKKIPTSPKSYLDAMHIQFECIKPVVASFSNLDT